MYGVAKLMPCAGRYAQLAPQTLAALGAALYARRRPVVPRRKYALVFHDYRAYLSGILKTARPRTDYFRHLHEAIVPFTPHLRSPLAIII